MREVREPEYAEDQWIDRYPKKGKTPLAWAQTLSNDMGLGPYKLKIQEAASPDVRRMGELTVGAYSPTHRTLTYASLDPDTIAHELMHAADHIFIGGMDRPAKEGPHHEAYANFGKDFPYQLRAQREIEELGATSPKALGAFPWLDQVVPHSSNRLAVPYDRKKPDFPASIWNLLQESTPTVRGFDSPMVDKPLERWHY